MKVEVELEAAKKEVEAWMDWRKIMPSQREEYAGSIAVLVEAVQYGQLSLKDNAFTQKLHFPIGEEIKIDTLVYKPRINVAMLKDYLKGVKPADGDARITAYLACLTGESKLILESLDPADTRIANSIVVFFVG